MAKYFTKFPLTYYTLDDNGYSEDIVTNLISRFGLERRVKNNALVYYAYDIRDGDTPEIIASKIYGSPERHWIVLLANDIFDVETQWPMKDSALVKYVDTKYSTEDINGLIWAKANIHSYYKKETVKIPAVSDEAVITEVQIDKTTYDNMVEDADNYPYTIVDGELIFSVMHDRPVLLADGHYSYITVEKYTKTYMEYEIELNEKKRQIKLFRKEFVLPLEEQIKTIFNERRS